uniref:Peptidase S1 domain-containing protein n=1 Tax=Strigamia maritima TaxID=126957 RepID=T1IUP9_STRMM
MHCCSFKLLMLLVAVSLCVGTVGTEVRSPVLADRIGLLGNNACFTKGQQGICTFIWHCHSRRGIGLAPCKKGILFGTCCRLPADEAKLEPVSINSIDKLKPHSSSQLSTNAQFHTTLSSVNRKTTVSRSKTTTPSPSTIWTKESERNPSSIVTRRPSYTTSTSTSNSKLTAHKPLSNVAKPLEKTTDKLPVEVTYAPLGNHWTFNGQITTPKVNHVHNFQDNSASILNIPLVHHNGNHGDEFPLHAIQQIIDDFAKETNKTSSTYSTIVEESQTSAVNEVTVVYVNTGIAESTSSESFWTTPAPVEPVVKFPIISVHVSNSTSSVSVVESAASFQEVAYSPQEQDNSPSPVTITEFPTSISTTKLSLQTIMGAASELSINTTPPKKKPSRRPTRKPTRKTTSSTTKKPTTKPWDYKKDCGVRPLAPTGRIVGGKKVFLGQWPWQVLVKEATWFGLVVKTKCGGVLISRKFVITAAHCQPGWLASLLVLLGEYDLTNENENLKTIQRNVRRVIAHRDFVQATFENDIALLEMDRPVDLQPHIVPVCLPPKTAYYTGETAIVSGWGRLSSGGALPSTLHYVDVPILSNSECQQMFLTAGQVKAIKSSFLCAGYSRGGKDSCEGDSGGPLTVQGSDGRWFLAGTVSHGIKCAYENLPGVYTRISSFRDWIDKYV